MTENELIMRPASYFRKDLHADFTIKVQVTVR